MSLSWVTFPEVRKILATTATTIAETVTTFLTATCDFLSDSDSVTALGHDPVLDLVAVGDGDDVDVFNPRTGKRVATIAVGETINAVSMYGGAVWVATATKGIYYADYRIDSAQNAGSGGLVDGLLWSTAEDTNPAWTGSTYTPPSLFLVEADAAGWQVWDVSSGAPVSDLIEAQLGMSSVAYREGRLYAAGTFGVIEYDWVTGVDTPYTTLTTPAIVNDTVNDIAATVLDSVDTTNLLSSTDDLSQVPQWGRTNCTVDVIGVTPCTGETAYRITGTGAFASILQPTGLAWSAGRYVYSFCMRQSPNSIRPCLRLQDGGSNSRTYEFVWTNGVPQFDNYKTATFGTPVDILYVQDTNDWWRVAVIIDALAVGTIQAAIYAEYDTSLGADIDCSSPQVEQSATLHGYVQSVTGPTTGQTPSAKQYVNEDIGGGVIVTNDTGLFVPTWGAATDGGLSVGRDNGDIWDITGQANQLPITQFTQDGKVAYGGNANSQIYVYDIPTADINETAFIRRYLPSASASDPGAPKILNSLGTSNTAFVAGTSLVMGFSEGLTIITEDLTNYFDGIYSWTTTTYNTGGMKQPDGAWACDNDPADIVAPALAPDYSSQANDLTVVGTVTKEATCVELDCCIQAIVVDNDNYLQGTVQTPGELQGYEQIDGTYLYRALTSEWVNATETAGALEIRSTDDTPVPVYQVRWNR